MSTQLEQPVLKTNRLAMVSFICGIGIIIPVACIVVSLNIAAAESGVMLFVISTYIASILGLVALVSGVIALWQIKNKAMIEKGREKAIAGIVLGILVCLPGLYIFAIDYFF